jgi:hypothetical protein
VAGLVQRVLRLVGESGESAPAGYTAHSLLPKNPLVLRMPPPAPATQNASRGVRLCPCTFKNL